jgi:CheY-like chemotaxis protein
LSFETEDGSHRGPILIVEDDFETRYMLATCLESAGYRVLTAANGREALATIHRDLPSVLVVDLMMPVMDGAEFRQIQRHRRGTASIPFVVVTAAANGREVAAQLGADGFLEKPVDVDQLVAVVGRLLAAAT